MACQWGTDVHCLPLSHPQLPLSLSLSPSLRPLYGNCVSSLSHTLWHVDCGCLSGLLVKLATMLQWCGRTSWLYKRQAAGERQRVRERKPISWEEYWSDHLFLPSSSSGSFSQRKRWSDKDSGEDGGWRRQRERDRLGGDGATAMFSLLGPQFSALRQWHGEQINNISTQSLKWCGSQALHYNHKCTSCSKAL